MHSQRGRLTRILPLPRLKTRDQHSAPDPGPHYQKRGADIEERVRLERRIEGIENGGFAAQNDDRRPQRSDQGKPKSKPTDLLADQLIAEVEQDPRIGGPAFVDLASFVATRRAAEAEQAGVPESQLGLLVLALAASESETASEERMTLAFEVSEEAMREGDPNLARRAIDRAVLDAQTVAPLDLDQLASLKIFKARIAGTRSEVHPRWSRSTFAATRELACSSPLRGWRVWAANAASQGRVAV